MGIVNNCRGMACHAPTFFILAGLGLILACSRHPAESPAAPPVKPASEPQVIIAARSGPEVAVRVELARTPAQREQGLMYRRELAPDAGMLFIFPEEGFPVFWMKNTLIPLDLIFINAASEVAGIVARARPESLDRLGVARPAKYVLEVNAGFCDLYHITVGARVKLAGTGE